MHQEDKPDFAAIGASMTELIPIFFSNFNPMPSKWYCEQVGWHVYEDGTVETPGLGRVPTSDLCEVKELEKLYEVSELERLYKLEENDAPRSSD